MFFVDFVQNSEFFRSLFSPCGNVTVVKNIGSSPMRSSVLSCSAPHRNGEVIYRCKRLRFEEDGQLWGGSTAVFSIIGKKGQNNS